MKVLIIGGAGYIGSHVTREFLDQGHQAVVFDNLSSGSEKNLFPNARFIKGDIRNIDSLQDAMREGFDGVVHLAAFKHVGESMQQPEKFALNNICGTINVLNAMLEEGIRDIVFSSTAALFGEPQYLPLDEQHPNHPQSFYGFTKLEIERIMAWYDALRGLKFIALRYFNAAGFDPAGRVTGLEKETFNLIPVLMEVACGLREKVQVFGTDFDTEDGSCVRDFIHVNDLAVAHVAALEYMLREKQSQIFNLGTEKGSSVLEILDLARKVTSHSIPAEITGRRPGDSSKLIASSKKAQLLLNWIPKYSDLNTILQTTWRVYQMHYLK